jgi:queuine/archaeosine tRNA-ribosyltransferase
MVGSSSLSYHADHFIRIYMQADCVFPTRTARFGVALTHKGPLNLSACLSFRRSRHFADTPLNKS